MIHSLAKAALGTNLATAVRLVRFGPRDALTRATAAYQAVRPFSAPEASPPDIGSEEPAEDPRDSVAAWDPTVAADGATPLAHSKVLDLGDFRHPELVRWIREVYAHEL